MDPFREIVNGQKPLSIFAKRSILNVWKSSEYTTTTNTEQKQIMKMHFA